MPFELSERIALSQFGRQVIPDPWSGSSKTPIAVVRRTQIDSNVSSKNVKSFVFIKAIGRCAHLSRWFVVYMCVRM